MNLQLLSQNFISASLWSYSSDGFNFTQHSLFSCLLKGNTGRNLPSVSRTLTSDLCPRTGKSASRAFCAFAMSELSVFETCHLSSMWWSQLLSILTNARLLSLQILPLSHFSIPSFWNTLNALKRPHVHSLSSEPNSAGHRARARHTPAERMKDLY